MMVYIATALSFVTRPIPRLMAVAVSSEMIPVPTMARAARLQAVAKLPIPVWWIGSILVVMMNFIAMAKKLASPVTLLQILLQVVLQVWTLSATIHFSVPLIAVTRPPTPALTSL